MCCTIFSSQQMSDEAYFLRCDLEVTPLAVPPIDSTDCFR